MVLDQIRLRLIAGFTIIGILISSVLIFKIKELKYQLSVEKEKISRYEQQIKLYNQQIKQLTNENQQLLSEINKLKEQISIMQRALSKQKQYTKKREIDKKTIKEITKPDKKGKVDDRKVIRFLNSIFDCDE